MKMALLNFLLIIVIFGNAFAEPQDAKLTDFIGENIEKALNGFIQSVADPLIVKLYDKTFIEGSKLLSGRLQLSNLNVTGVKSAAVKNTSVDIFSSQFNMTIDVKQIILYCDYDIDLMLISWIPFYGKGNISATLDGLNMELHLTASIDILKPQLITNLGINDIKLLLGNNTSFNIEGLMNDDDYNELVNELFQEYIQYVIEDPEKAGKEITDLLQAVLNYIKKKKI